MERAFTKITSLILVMMILMSSLSTTIVYAADEIKGTDEEIVQNTDSLDETSDGNQEDENVPEDADKKESEPLADDGSENVGEESVDSEEEHEDEGEPKLEPDNQRPRLMSSPRNTANTQNTENQSEEDDFLATGDVNIEIKPTTKEDVESLRANNKFKSKNDKYEIRTFVSFFVSGAKKDENDNLVWTANNSYSGHEFAFRVNYATSGVGELPAGSVQITIPKSILRDREGNLADEFIMSLPTLEEYEEEQGITEFVYKEDGDYIVVYNPKEITAAVNGYFEVSYSTTKSTLYYKDYDPTNPGLVKDGGTASDPFYAIMSVNVGDETLNSTTDDTSVFVNTTAKISSTEKHYPGLYRSWNPQWMEEIPADSDDYYYLVWEIKSYVGYPTQKYNFKLEDAVEDLTEGTTGEDYEIVGYKLSGERYYSDKNMQTNLTMSEYRYDYVLTRHKKSTYSPISYKLKNTITATVDPVDQVDEDTKQTSFNTFNWGPSFGAPSGHFDIGKYGNNNWYRRFGYHWDYANYNLDRLQNYQETGVTELKGFKYHTETTGYSYPWTIRQGGASDNPSDYGYNYINYDTWDDSLYLEEDENPMSTNDYYLEYFTYSISNTDAEYDDFYQKFNTIPAVYDDDEVITFYAKFNGGDTWTEIGTYNLKTKTLSPNTEYVSEMTTSKVTFKEGVHATGWRFTTRNKHYSTYIVLIPYFVLTNSEYVQEKIRDKDKIQIQNFVNLKVTDDDENVIFAKDSTAIDYARVTYYTSDITKKVASVSNNRAKRVYTITWKVNAWEKATSGTGEFEYVWQDSGVFYDLIPLGGVVDLESIQVQTQEGFLEENSYTYEVIDNYKKSGRTMLIIRIKEQAQYYTVYYNTLHTWDSMKDYGRNVLNPVAYETGNSEITDGYPDNGGELSFVNKLIFNDLDKTTDDKKFIYTETPHTINALTAAISGLDKKVKAEKSSGYSYSAVTEPDGRYSYKLRYQNTFMNTAKNLILFDSLENFEIIDSDAQTVTTSSWHGKLQSIDLAQLKDKGIDAKIYISTIENLNLENHNDLTDTSVWQLVSEDANLEQAKAIAIDMRKDINGEDFILDSGDSVTATLHMKAPSEISEEMEQNPYTYNNIYIQNTVIDDFNSSEDYFIHQDYTRVRYHVIADVSFRKVNEQDKTEGIKGISFRLYGTSRYGTEVDTYATSDKDGYIAFKDIEAGTYTLQEGEGLIDWVEDHTEHEVMIDIHKNVYIDNRLVTSPDTVKITNIPRAHTDVEMYKKDLVSKTKVVEGAKFKLEGTSDYGNEILMYATSNEEGKLTFSNLEKGKYELKEIKSPEGYVLGEEVYQVIVDENSNYNVLLMSEEELIPTYENGKYNLYNEPLHSFTIVKKDSYDGSLIVGAKFRLHGVSDYSTSYDKEVTSVSGGLAIFDELEAGTYILQETFVPDVEEDGNTITYILDENKYIVTVKKDGTTTIDGLEKNPFGNFEFFNDRNKGQITITKEWVDDKTNEERQDPTIKVSTKRPERTTYVQFRDNVNFGPLYYITNSTQFRTKITGEFKRNIVLTEEDVVALGATRLDVDYNNPDAKYKIYGWIDENGNCYWWSNAEIALLTDNSRRMFTDSSNIQSIDITGINTSNVTNMSNMFGNCKKLTSLNLSSIDTSNVTNMQSMFSNCTGLTSLDVSNFNTSNVTNMQSMFFSCNGLTSLDVSNFNTNNVTNMQSMFSNCTGLTSLDVSNFNTSNVTNMSSMFSGCRGLTSLDLSRFNTNNVTNMSYMFSSCSGLTSLDVSNFNTSNVTNMSSMFSGCRGLTSLDLSRFNTSNVTDMSSMFGSCSGLTSVDVSNFDTSKVTSMNNMFNGCSGLTNLDVSNFDTSKVTSMGSMFSGCSKLTSLDVSNFDTSNVTNMSYMFSRCSKLTSLDVSNFDTSNVTNMSYMFNGCSGLTSLDVSSFDTSKVTNMGSMFYGCTKLTSLDVSNWNTSNVTNMGDMFYNCSELTNLDVSDWNTSNVTNMQEMFYNCSKLTNLDVSHFDTRNVTSMSSMFTNCSKLTSLDVSNFDTSKITNMSSIFSGCSGLTSLDVSNFDTSNVTNLNDMFRNCKGLTSLNVNNFDTSNVTSMSSIFNSCSGLTSLDVSNFDTSNVTSMYAMFGSCSGLTSLDVSNFDTSKVTSMGSMFSGCSGLTSLNVSSFDTSNVTSMSSMFGSCSGLTSLDVSNFDTSKVTSMGGMFSGCSGLTSLNVSNFDTSKVTSMNSMFSYCSGLTSLDLSNFDTSNVTSMYMMFSGCGGLTSLDVSNFDTSNVTNMSYMFDECSGLTSLDLSNFDTSNVINTRGMFFECSVLTTIYASSDFVTTKVSSSDSMFYNCRNLVGGNGTTYRSTDKTYARIDTPETPGYFTEKTSPSGAVNTNNYLLALNDIIDSTDDDVSVTISRTDYLTTTYMMAGNTTDGEITYSTSETNYDDQGNEIHWVKDGNVWTYTLYVEDPNADWFVWEEPVPAGYISNYTIDNPGEVENQQIEIVNLLSKDPSGGSSGSSDDEDITVKYGNLSVAKVVKDYEGNVLDRDDDSTEFTVTISLTAPTGYESLFSGTKIFGDYVFKDGVGTVKLHAGETITIPGIIEGTTYSVLEKDLGPYETSCDSNSGTISSETDGSVTYTNVKKPTRSGGSSGQDEPDPDYVDVKIVKLVTGYFEDNDDSNFEIILNNLVPNQTYIIEKHTDTSTQEISFIADDVGSVNVQLQLKNNEYAVLKDLPVGARYKVFEYAGEYTSSYSIVDNNNQNKVSNTANLNTKENKSLSTANETADADEDITITFTNKKAVVQDLKLVKQVTSVDDTNSYTFEIVFSNMSEGTSFNSSIGKVTADQDGLAELTVYLAGGEEVEFYNIPVGTKYQVTELASTAIASYVIADSNGMNKIDSASGANTNPKNALSTELETVNQGEEATIAFVNDTTTIDEDDMQDSVETSIGITKIVLDENDKVLDDCSDTFKFELKAKDETSPIPESTEVTITGNGTGSFGTIKFTETGTYTYTIKEIADETESYVYDDSEYVIVYEVTKPEGLLEITKTVTKNGFRADAITFTNKVYVEPEEDTPENPDDKDDKDDTIDNDDTDNNESSSDESNQDNNDNRNESASTKTGDVIWIYIADMIAAGIILVVSIKSKKRRR